MSRIEELTAEVADGNLEVLDELKTLTMEINKRKQCLAMHKTPISQLKDGRWRTRIGTKQIAKTKLSDLEDAIVDYYSKELKQKTFRDVFEEWFSEKKEYEEIRKSSLTRYRTDFNRFFPEDEPFCKIELSELTDSDLERFIKRTIKRCGLTRKTYGGLSILLRGVLKFAKREKYTTFSASVFFDDLMLPDNLFTKRKPKEDSEEVFSEEEAALLMDYFDANPSLHHYGLKMMLLSGLRIGELTALRKDAVHLNDLYLDVKASEIQFDDETGHRVVEVEDMPKTDEGRRKVLLPDSAGLVLKKILMMSPAGEWVFAYDDGRRMRSKSFNDALKQACKKVGIQKRTTHKARKTYASTLIDAGVNAKIIQKQMGHKDFQTTKKYYDRDRTGDDYKRAEINRAVINM